MKYMIVNKCTIEMSEFMRKRYQSAFMTDAYLISKYIKKGIELQYYITFDGEETNFIDILPFYVEGEKAIVVSWLTKIEHSLSSLFEKELFSNYSQLKSIEWQKTLNQIESINAFSCVDNSDMCISLPSTKEEYNDMLSRNSRKIYINKTHRVERDMDEMAIDVQPNDNNIYMVDSLLAWKEEQLSRKGEKSKASAELIKDVLKQIGSLSYIKESGKEICVCVFYKVGSHVFLEQTAYDDNEKYLRYSPGRVLLYQSILSFIDSGFTHFHFLWKGADYKKHYSAEEVPVYNTLVFKRKNVGYYSSVLKIKLRLLLRRIKRSKFGEKLVPIYNKLH